MCSRLSEERIEVAEDLNRFTSGRPVCGCFPPSARMEAGGDPNTEPGLTAEGESSELLCPENEPISCSSFTLSDDASTKGYWSQNSISRSLHRAEFLLRNTFNPNLKRLFQIQSQDEEEENFVIAHNLVSRSSTRLLRLQQALPTGAPSWQMVGDAQAGSSQEHHRTLRRLVMQRSLLLFIHEFTRRAHLAAAYVSRVAHLLKNQLSECQLLLSQDLLNLPSDGVSLSSLSQELRVHLNHWPCLFSRVQSDTCLRLALLQQKGLLREVQRSLELLRLQALVLMEQYIYRILSVVAKTDLDFVQKEVLEHILTGIDLYNQAVEEQRLQRGGFHLTSAILQQAHYSTVDCFPTQKIRHPSSFSAKELLAILAVHHADMVAKKLQYWASEQAGHVCPIHTNHNTFGFCNNCQSGVDTLGCGISSRCSNMNWDQLQQKYLAFPPMCSKNHCSLQSSSSSSCEKCNHAAPLCRPDFHWDNEKWRNDPILATWNCGYQRDIVQKENQPHDRPTTVGDPASVHHTVEKTKKSSNCQLSHCLPHAATANDEGSDLHLSGVCQGDHFSVEVFLQALVSSNELVAPMVPHTCALQGPTDLLSTKVATDFKGKADSLTACSSVVNPSYSEEWRTSTNVENQNTESNHKGTNTPTTEPDGKDSSCPYRNLKAVEEEQKAPVQPDSARWPHSVQWSDLGQSLMFAELLDQYCTLLKTFCSEAMLIQLHTPQAMDCAESINLQDFHRAFQFLYRLSQASKTGLLLKECSTLLGNFSDYLFVITAHSYWDHEVCRSLGSALKDKCPTNPGTNLMMAKQDRTEMMSRTTGHFLSLLPPLLSSLTCHHSGSKASGVVSLVPSRFALRKQTVCLVLASVQLSSIWVMSRAYQFLSSWSLSRFLLISQGDLQILKESLQMFLHQTKSMVMSSDGDLHNYHQLVLMQQLEALEKALNELQSFSFHVLRTFSWDCKRMSGEIFERTMPSAVHWRPGHKTGFPSSPSEYASLAAQAVIGQVLEGVAPLPDDLRVQALSITMTAFMEAWMEHILNKKIKFSVQGALQLKQDFDSIREMIQSDRYGLSADLHQRLLSLRVFQQVDSAVVCLLQQPQAKSYLHSGAWEPFTRCCPTNANRDSIDAPVSSSITHLTCMEGEDLTQSYPSVETANLTPIDPSTPEEPYLAPSLALGTAQQQWLDLRIQHSARRWRLPGLQCFSKSES